MTPVTDEGPFIATPTTRIRFEPEPTVCDHDSVVATHGVQELLVAASNAITVGACTRGVTVEAISNANTTARTVTAGSLNERVT